MAQKRRDTCLSALVVEGVDQCHAVGTETQAVFAQACGNACQGILQVQGQLLLAELMHQGGLILDQDQLATADDTDAVGHFLGFLDVMRGQDDGHA